jgi:two-component system sensor histidine kinase HupT/HoxJ
VSSEPGRRGARALAAARGCFECELIDYEIVLEERNSRLEEWRQFIDGVLGSMSDVLIACDANGVIEKVNPSLERLVGRPEAALRGTLLWDLLADETSRARAGHFPRELHLGTIEDCELSIRAADGSPHPVAVNCTPRLSPAGQFVGMVVTGRSVGELRRAYGALQAAHEELKRAQAELVQAEKMASLGRLVAGVAHELNNPVSFVLGNAHALRRYGERVSLYIEAQHSGANAQELARLRETLKIDRLLADLGSLIEGTVEGAERARDIVAGLRGFSATSHTGAEPFNVADVVAKAVHWVTRATASRIAVDVSAPPEAIASGSAVEIQQVLMNVVRNAIDATEELAAPRLAIDVASDSVCVTVTATDNGPGFRGDALARAFDPFFTTKPVGKGTGLGLAISYAIVERHGGTIAAENVPGGGARVTLRLPAWTGGRAA